MHNNILHLKKNGTITIKKHQIKALKTLMYFK